MMPTELAPRYRPNWRAWGALLATGSLLTACAAGSPPTLRTTDRYLHHAHDIAGPLCDEKSSIPAADGELIGPHFGFTVSCAYTTDSLADGPDMSEVYPNELPYPPFPDREFVVVQIAREAPPGVPAAIDTAEAEAFLLLDGERQPLAEVPQPGDVLVFVVPVDIPVQLAVDDADRVQRFDLRQHLRHDEVPGYYHGIEGEIATPGYSVRIEGENASWTGWAEASGDILAERTVWNPSAGWASPGEAWLTLVVEWPQFGHTDIDWNLWPDHSLKLSDVDGGKHYSPFDVITEEGTDQVLFTLRYTVPDDLVKLTVTFQPKGDFLIVEDGSTLKTTKAPKANTFDIDFSRE